LRITVDFGNSTGTCNIPVFPATLMMAGIGNPVGQSVRNFTGISQKLSI